METQTKRGVEVGRYPDYSRRTADHQLTIALTPEQTATLQYSKDPNYWPVWNRKDIRFKV
jgi:Spy/CpxP family protein refolding chaperone